MDTRWNRIDEADHSLFLLNNQRSLLEYRLDLGSDDVAVRISDIQARIAGVLNRPSLLEAIRTCRREQVAPEDGLAIRKLALIEREVAFSTLDNSSELNEISRLVSRGTRNPDTPRLMSVLARSPVRQARREALEALARIHAGVEPACRDLLSAANRLARGAGYDGYAAAKLGYEGMTVDQLYRLLREWRDERLPRWRYLLTRAGERLGHQVQACDLLYVLGQQGSGWDEAFDPAGRTVFLSQLLARLGASLDQLPISIEYHGIPAGGACYRVMPGADVRILLNSGLTGFAAYFYLLHELGHAIYYCFCPVGSELLIDNHLAREIMADLWTHFLKEKSCLVGILGLSPDLADEVARARSEIEVLRLFLYMRDAIFTLEVLKDPETPFSETWRAVSNDWLGIDDGSGAFEVLDFMHLLDMKSYVLAQVLSGAAFSSLSSLGTEVLETPGAFGAMVDRFYRPGNAVDWKARLGAGEV